ncbi:50S ribosomal protein L23 [Candidatus Saccharibacteria bacterium]|nr:50S ribosomal protein L23 [Candidatus Saccharibacteria bacterium]
MKALALKPRVSEKAYALSESGNVFTFDIGPGVNKFDVAKAVAAQYKVSVEKVRIVTVPGKATRSYRQRGRRSFNGQRSDVRKAYVTLKAGDKLPIFAAMEELKAPEEKK